MVLIFCLNVGRMGSVRRIEHPEVNRLPADGYPAAEAAGFFGPHTLRKRPICLRPAVAHVFLVGAEAKIFYAVVERVAIDVIDDLSAFSASQKAMQVDPLSTVIADGVHVLSTLRNNAKAEPVTGGNSRPVIVDDGGQSNVFQRYFHAAPMKNPGHRWSGVKESGGWLAVRLVDQVFDRYADFLGAEGVTDALQGVHIGLPATGLVVADRGTGSNAGRFCQFDLRHTGQLSVMADLAHVGPLLNMAFKLIKQTVKDKCLNVMLNGSR